ncbi:MAG: KTSC domain-containing protein [Pseudorhodoplanes sp.]|nr:KTSC domain-containing protein [Pseudorhodoplanes sp.]
MTLKPHPLQPGPMPEIHLLSAVIRKVAYDSDARRLYVTFVNRQTYRYEGVSPDTFRGLLAAPSKGDYFNTAIRGNYSFHKVA